MRLREVFTGSRPDVLELLDRQAQVSTEGLQAFARWAATGEETSAQQVRDLEHAADDARHQLLARLLNSLEAPIDQEDLYLLSERLDAVVNGAKNIVREAQVLQWHPDTHMSVMAASAAGAMACLCLAISRIQADGTKSIERTKRATKLANAIEHHYRLAVRSAVTEPLTADAVTALEMYRRMAGLGETILRVAHRAWYTLVKER